MALRRGSPVRSLSRRATKWGLGPQEADGSTAATGQQLWSSAVALTTTPAATIVRIRGNAVIHLKTATAAGDGFRYGLGLGLVTAEAFAVGATAISGPLSEGEWDGWIWHRFGAVQFVIATIADGVNAATVVDRFVIDSKVMRKWTDGMLLVGMTETTELGTASMEAQIDSRVLVKLG